MCDGRHPSSASKGLTIIIIGAPFRKPLRPHSMGIRRLGACTRKASRRLSRGVAAGIHEPEQQKNTSVNRAMSPPEAISGLTSIP
jgi:hypothetical protein